MIAVDAYSKPQIALHWLIVVLVAAQFVSAGAMEQFFDKAEDARELAGFPTDPEAIAHAIGAALSLFSCSSASACALRMVPHRRRPP